MIRTCINCHISIIKCLSSNSEGQKHGRETSSLQMNLCDFIITSPWLTESMIEFMTSKVKTTFFITDQCQITLKSKSWEIRRSQNAELMGIEYHIYTLLKLWYSYKPFFKMNLIVIYYFLARIGDACRYFQSCFMMGDLRRTFVLLVYSCSVSMFIDRFPIYHIQSTTRRILRVFPADNVLKFD